MKVLYILNVKFEAEVRVRDEFGWVDGQGPGNGNYQEDRDIVRVLAPSADWAKLWVVNHYKGDGVRNPEVLSVAQLAIDAEVNVT